MSGVQIDALPHDCGSKRGLKVFAQEDGTIDGFCFSCSTFVKDPYGDGRNVANAPKRREKSPEDLQAELAEVSGYPVVSVAERRLREATLEKFGAKVSMSEKDGVTPTAIYWPVTKAGKLSGYHVKVLDKSCPPYNIGDTRDCDLLNWENAKASGAYRLIITEGPEDMASVDRIYEMHGKDEDYHPAVVSLPHGASSAKKVLTKHAEEIRRLFKEVILCFDNDGPGQTAVEKAMQALPHAKSVLLPTKDANAALIEGKAKAAYNALAYHSAPPKNTRIVTAAEIHEAAKEPAKFGELSWPWRQMNEDLRGIRLGETIYLGAGTKMGKALSDTSIIQTPFGTKWMGDIKEGDYVLGTSGKAVKVLGVYPQGVVDIYRVTFDDGQIAECSLDHLWTVADQTKGASFKFQTVTTKQLIILLSKANARIYLPRTASLKYGLEEEPLLIDPYVLGVWLGDGARGCGRISVPDQEIWDQIENCGYKLGKVTDGSCRTQTLLGLHVNLKSYYLSPRKFIPPEYRWSSFKNRLAVFQGLMDTDGWVNPAQGKTKAPAVKFGSTDEQLYFDFVSLGRSLGLKVRECKPKETSHKLFYHCTITSNGLFDLFRLQRKQTRVTTPSRAGHLHIRVKSVEYSHKEAATCIEVDSEDKLFLCADSIPTHNTTVKNALGAHFIANDEVPIFMAAPEEPNVMTYKLLANQLTGKIFHDPSIPFDEDAYEYAGSILRDKLMMLNLYQYLGWESLKRDINDAVERGAKAVFIDPVTSLSNGVNSGDANTLLQSFSQELAAMAADMQFAAFIFCHLKAPEGQIAEDKRNAFYKQQQYVDLGNCSHEMGGSVYSSQFAGSRAMQRSCHLMLALLGNKDPDLDESIRNTRELRVLEDRMWGSSGKYPLFYNKNTGRFQEL